MKGLQEVGWPAPPQYGLGSDQRQGWLGGRTAGWSGCGGPIGDWRKDHRGVGGPAPPPDQAGSLAIVGT